MNKLSFFKDFKIYFLLSLITGILFLISVIMDPSVNDPSLIEYVLIPIVVALFIMFLPLLVSLFLGREWFRFTFYVFWGICTFIVPVILYISSKLGDKS